MDGLDFLLGAGEGLSTQYIVVRLRAIDMAKLKEVINAPVLAAPRSNWGGVLAPALDAVDAYPKLALDIGLPLAQRELAKVGITADLSVANAPPPPRVKSEFWGGTVAGGGLVALGFVIYRWWSARK